MKSREECEKILGCDLLKKIEGTLKSKSIDEHTTMRVVDYLALHKLAFPYVDINLVAGNLCNNIKSSINFRNIKESLRGLFKEKAYGFVAGGHMTINTKALEFVLPSKHYNVMLDALIRHELDHIATTRHVQFTKEEYVNHLLQNISYEKQLFGNKSVNAEFEHGDRIKRAIDYKFRCGEFANWNRGGGEIKSIMLEQSGIEGRVDAVGIEGMLGSSALNEGVTAYKMKIMDKHAGQGGFMCQSGYVLGEEVSKHFADIIGEEKFISMQISGDFVGILKSYKEKTGKSGEEMLEILKNLEGGKYKTAFHKLFAQARYAVKNEMDKATKAKLDQITKPAEK